MIAVGVDTHKQRHHAGGARSARAVARRALGFAASAAGYAELQRWAEGLREEQPLVLRDRGRGQLGRRALRALAGRRP